MQKKIPREISPPYALIVIFLLSAAVIVASFWYAYRNQARDFRASVSRQLSIIADFKVAELTRWRSERVADLDSLRGNPSFKAMVRDFFDGPSRAGLRDDLQTWLSLIQQHYGYEAVFLFDARARQRLAAPAGANSDCDVLRRHLDAGKCADETVFVDLHSHGPQGHVHLAEAAPVFDRGLCLGFVVFDIDVRTYLYPLLKSWPTDSSTAETLIVRRDGDDVLFLNALRFRPDAALRLRIPLARTQVPAVRAVLGYQGVVEGVDYRGQKVIAAVRDVPGLPWKMIGKMDTAEVFAGLRERRNILILQVVILLLALVFVLGLTWRQQRVNQLRRRVGRQQRFAGSIAGLLGSIEGAAAPEKRLAYITEVGARAMAVRRCSIWSYSDDYSRIVCLDLYDAALDTHSSGEILPAADFAAYTASHQQGQVIAAEDVFNDPRTRDIPANYYRTAGISSLLDAPVWRQGRLVALFSFEQVGNRRRWEPDEQQFAQTLAAHVSNTLEAQDRARAEAALEQSERRLRQLFDGTRDGIVSVDANGRFLSANRAYCDLVGYSIEELRSMEDFYAITPQRWRDWERHEIWNNRLLKTGESGLYEKEYIRKDGSILPVELQSFTVPDERGGVAYLWGVARDISDRKRAEQDLAIQADTAEAFLTVADEDLYDRVLGVVLKYLKSPLGVFGYIDDDGALVVPTMTRQAWDKCRVANKSVRFPRQDWGDSSWPRALREGKMNFSNQPSSRTPEGHLPVSRYLTMPIMQGREAVGLLQVANKRDDYTPDDIRILRQIADRVAPILVARLARTRFNNQLLKRNEELASFSYAVSHDLRGPLVTLKTFMGYLEKDMASGSVDRVGRDISFMRIATDKMSAMLDELLVLTRVGRVNSPLVSAPLQAVVRDAMSAVAGRMSERGVNVKVTLAPLMLHGDRPRLVAVFQNLIDNAVKFMGDQNSPLIEIGFENVEGTCELFVRDNGMGIDPRHQAGIFNLFEKLDPSAEGTGMGLAMVKRIVEEHGGTIRVESDGPGKGTCFRFTLPGKEKGDVQS